MEDIGIAIVRRSVSEVGDRMKSGRIRSRVKNEELQEAGRRSMCPERGGRPGKATAIALARGQESKGV